MGPWRKAVPLGVLVAFNVLSAGLWFSAARYDKESAWLSSQTTKYSATEPFLAQGRLLSPSSATLASPHQRQPCLAYRTRVELVYERTTHDDGRETVRHSVYDERHKVADLAVQFASDLAYLDIARVDRFYQTAKERLEKAPDYIPRENLVKVPKKGPYRFEVEEDLFRPGQDVFVAARLSSQGALEAHPTLGRLVVFPGSQAECVDAFASRSRTNKVVALVLSAISVLLAAVLWKVTAPTRES